MQPIVVSPVIDGSSISFAENEVNLMLVIAKTRSAVFCRVTPGQKAEVVRLVKRMDKRTLAVGDGANDVNMIMEANVGVGIFGEEGTRAAQVANYAIGEFCLLWKLLLFYGRLNYIRISEMVLYFFYKNVVFTVIQVIFCFYSMGSGESFWLSWSITFFNMIFTFFPVVLRAVFEVDL
jgi:P-type E1-E2 ATPase